MINRVTESMKFNTITNNLFNVQGQSAELMEKLSTQKMINRPSDNPIGAGNVLNYRSVMASIEQYQTNISNAKTWLSMTDTNLSGIKDIVARAKDIAVSQSSAVASAETMNASAAVLSSLIGDALSLLNAKQGDSYLFSGSRTDVAPFVTTPAVASIGDVSAAATNLFGGTATSGGAFTGTEDKSYAVKIVTGGAFGTATYRISDDGGKTWSDAPQTVPASGIVSLGDGVTMTFAGGPPALAANDLFTVKVSFVPVIGSAAAATANVFNGTVSSGGVYTGTENKTYAVKIAGGGTLAASTYQVSADGGKTWGVLQNFPPQVLRGDVANTAGGSPITAATVWDAIDGANVQDGTTIDISGFNHNGIAVGPDTYTIADASTETVQDLLDQIETSFGGTVTATIDTAGRITVTDNASGASQLAMSLAVTNQPGGSLNLGAVTAMTTTSVNLGDGITMTFNDSGSAQLTTNDIFTVNGYAVGYYRGNDDSLTMQVGKNNDFIYNITGSGAFTANRGPVASATIDNAGALTLEDTITLTRGDSVGSWSITNHEQYPNMVITSSSATEIKINADGAAGADITISLSGEWQKGNTASFTIIEGGTPPTPVISPVTVSGPGTVDLMKTLNTLKEALEAHDVTAVAAQIDVLINVQSQVLQKQTETGAKMNSLDLTSNNHKAFNEQITAMKSGIEDVDLAKLITAFQMKEIAMQASYNMASQIGKMTIMNYI